MRFYKICSHGHPTSKLPSVLWDDASGRPLFEFLRTDILKVLALDTEDAELIALLTEAGYVTEAGEGGNIKAMAMAGQVPEGTELPQPQLTPETKNALRRFTK